MEESLQLIGFHLVKLGTAYLLAMPVAWNRERGNGRNAGLRTFPLVAIATCGYMLVALQVLGDAESESRVMVGLITGMGFIGGGAIIKHQGHVSGTATAASLWVTGAIGIAVAFERYEIAIVLSLVTFFTLQFFPYVKEQATSN